MVFYTLASMVSDASNIQIGAFIFGFAFGATIAFVAVPMFIKNDFFAGALAIQFFLSFTYIGSTDFVYGLMIKYKAMEISPKYSKNIEWLATKDYTSSNTVGIEKEERLLIKKQAEYDRKKVTIDSIGIGKEVFSEFYKMKKGNKTEYKKYYTKQALEHGCKVLKFDPLVDCVTEDKVNTATITANKDLSPLIVEISTLKKTIVAKKKSNENAVSTTAKNNSLINEKIEENKEIVKQAQEQSVSKKTIAFALWIVGVMIEVVFIGIEMINIILARRKERLEVEKELEEEELRYQDEKRRIDMAKEEKSRELESLVANVKRRDYENEVNWIIDYANNDAHPFRYTLAWKRGKGVRIGTTIAFSNAIMGAFLYILTKRMPVSYLELTISNILEVNGLIGETKAETYVSNRGENVAVLGSTSRNLKITKVTNGVKHYEILNPQTMAIDFLINHEEFGYSIEELTIKKMEELAVAFTREVYPEQFE
jgi:hypothetical protein